MNYGLIGERLGHSFSKSIHNQLFDYDYELKEIPRDELDAFMQAKEFRAINVTIPYKEAVIPYLDEISDIARRIGAVNTIVNRDGQLYGDNTDFSGMTALIDHAGISVAGKQVLILGSGGTSKTALAVAQHLGCAGAVRASRSGRDGCDTYDHVLTHADDFEILINTTPAGMFPRIGESAVDIAAFPSLTGVVDAVYNPLRSKLVCDALERGIPAVGGLYMLVAQAVFAAEKFTGQTVPANAIRHIYSRMVREKQNIVLVGMPGCGKSTAGKRLAKERSMTFIDTDEEIVRRKGHPIPAIFEAVGEAGFRDIESAVIREVSAVQGAVIATGGGAILRRDNVRLLKENGRLYFLDRPLDLLVTTADRPLSADRQALEQRYRERYGLYGGCCDCRIVSDGTVEQTVQDIKEDADHEIAGA